MKRLLMTSIATLMLAGSFSLPAVAQSRGAFASHQGTNSDQDDRGNHANRGDRGARPGQPNGSTELQGQPGQNRGARPGQPQTQQYQGQQYQGQQYQGEQAQSQYRGGDRNRDDSRNRNYADNRSHDQRYDNRNGQRYDTRRDWRDTQRWDRHDWRRGERLGDWNRRYYEVDYREYRDYRLYNPPYGYRWVRDDNGDFLLAALAGGLIAAIIANN
jgi:Ni/Co efflux regulator RcnB